MARSEAGLEAGLEASIEASIEAGRPPRCVLVRVAYAAPVPRSVSYGALLALVACGAATPTLLGPSEAEREELEAAPDLRRRLARSEHDFFRFANRPFARQVCADLGGAVRAAPTVNLHGDAHVEQYAVTPEGRGLADFDDATEGPAAIDLVRFGVSLEIVRRARGWDEGAGPFAAFLEGYRDALREPEAEQPPPAVAARMQATFTADREPFLREVEELMEPVEDAGVRAEIEEGYGRYRRMMEVEHPELPAHFFELRSYGRLRGGVGSRLDPKFLARVEGWTEAPNDDVVLEAKEVRELSMVPCVQSGTGRGGFRVLVAHARLTANPSPFLGIVPRAPSEAHDDPPFWVQEWSHNYRELELGALRDGGELRELARDVGVQLGRGHVRLIAAPFDSQLRFAQLEWLREREGWLREEVRRMTALVARSWRAYRDE